ncbi:MAG: hypothetical protein HWD63_00430 [Candidatus Parvibacillus calidus]|nr:MAG: hypothetical protein HWD63_00430 [Candidatus Parvibacillus calidus]
MNEEFKSLTIDAFRQKFSTIEQCIEYLASCKWGNGYSCRQCGHNNYCKGALRRSPMYKVQQDRKRQSQHPVSQHEDTP